MSWQALLELISEEVGEEAAKRIECIARRTLGGMRITIAKKPLITINDIDQVAPGRPKDAARQLGVHPSTIYRRLQSQRVIR